jgi:hypothetical protein
MVGNTEDPRWEQFMDMRCCAGWVLDAEVLVTGARTSTHGGSKVVSERLHMDPLIIGSSQGGAVMLYHEGNETSYTLNIQLDLFPNHSDMYCLSRDCILESYLPKLLTEELLQSAENLISSNESEGLESSKFLEALECSFRRLATCIHADSLRALLAKHLLDAGDDMGSVSSGHASSASSPPLQGLDYTHSFPDEIETFRAIACARQFFRYILKDFKPFCVPEPTTGLVEKLLALYMSAAQDIINERDSVGSCGPTGAIQLDEIITFSLFVDFVLVASVWYLEHAFLYVNINDDYNISPVEINAIWSR